MVKKFSLQHYLNHLKNPNKQKLHKQLTKRSKWFQKHSQNVQNGKIHDFSLNASQHAQRSFECVLKRSKGLSVVGGKMG